MPYRISDKKLIQLKDVTSDSVRGAALAGAGPQKQIDPDKTVDQYYKRLLNLLPAEVLPLYLAGVSLIPEEESIALVGWALFCLFAVIYVFYMGSQKNPENPDKKYSPKYSQIIIGAISFVIWVYTLGGPFEAYDLHSAWLGSLLLLGWTFLAAPFSVNLGGAETDQDEGEAEPEENEDE